MTAIYDFNAKALDGKDVSLGDWRGKVMLVVNTASKCGFTYQYEGLEALHRQYAERGLAILGFPCNQFRKQEPGDAAEIANFCSLTYDVTFPMFAKIDVNGDGAHPLYKWITKEKRGLLGSSSIKWNFTKFLVDRAGKVVGRFGPTVKPQALTGAIEKLL